MPREDLEPKNSAPLDLLSISQTFSLPIDLETGEKRALAFERCSYGAPLVAMVFRGNAAIQQACCNHWDCPRCGLTRAKTEYRRMTWGAQVLADEGRDLYFWTLTCRGKEVDYETAMDGYLSWSNRWLTNARTKACRAGEYWAYCAVTQHQKKTREHPHSHLLSPFLPDDAIPTSRNDGHEHFVSRWATRSMVNAGLGIQYDISKVDSIAAAAHYIARYMFRSAITEQWPPKWKRVRYSQNWPKPPYIPADWAITLLTPEHWREAAYRPETFTCEGEDVYRMAEKRMANIRKRQSDVQF